MFKDILNLVLINEGGYSNHPLDTGGETYKGISRKYNSDWEGWIIIDNYKKENNFPNVLNQDTILDEQVASLYRVKYWDTIKGDEITKLHPNLAYQVFDFGVNAGIKTASKQLQKICNILNRDYFNSLFEDGLIGPATLNAVTLVGLNRGKNIIIQAYQAYRLNHYINIIENNTTQKVFIKSWLKRVFERLDG